MHTRVLPEVYDKAHLMAEELGISLSALLSELVEREQVTERGRPLWDSRYSKAETQDDALPLSA